MAIGATSYFAAAGFNEPFGFDDPHVSNDRIRSLIDLLANLGGYGLLLGEVSSFAFGDENYLFGTDIFIVNAKGHHTPRVDARHLVDQPFQVLGVDILPTYDDEFFLASSDVDLAVGNVADIAGTVPIIQEGFLGGIWALEIFR